MSWREALRGYIAREARPVEKFGHQPRLYSLTKQLGAGFEYDDDVVYAAVWLHDLGVFYGHRPEDPEALKSWDNTKYAMEKAPGVLETAGFPMEKAPAVVEAIRTHQSFREPVNMEGVLLRDADILEQLGAVGVLRTVCKVGRDTRFSTFTDAVKALRKAVEMLPRLLSLDASKEIARGRIEILHEFLEAVALESGDFLF